MRRALALALVFLAACSGGEWSYTTPAVLDAPALLAELRPRGAEKLVLANFWAAWCGPCLAEMPELVALGRAWTARGVRVEAVSIDLAERGQIDSAEKLAAFAEHHDLALPLVAFKGDWDALSAQLKIPEGPPCTLLLGPDGAELGRIEGSADRAQFEALIAKALAR